MPREFSIPHIDPVAVVESSLHSMFINTFNKEEVRTYFGFSRISPIYSENGFPGWYLWFDEQPGAYGIFVTEAVCLDNRAEEYSSFSTIATRLRVEYYPSPEERTFEQFSCFERVLRVSAFFDDTGTPTMEGRREIDEGFFTVGYLEFKIHSDIGILNSLLAAPNRWMDIRSEGLKLSDEKGNLFQAVNPGEKDRSVPGWHLSSFIFDKLNVGYLYWQKCSPNSINLYEQDMPEFVIKQNNQVDIKYELGLKWYIAQIIYTGGDPISAEREAYISDMSWRGALYADPCENNCQERLLNTFDKFTTDLSAMGFSNWWTVKDVDLHPKHGELCSCYAAH